MLPPDPTQTFVNVKIILSIIANPGAPVVLLSGDPQEWKYPVGVYSGQSDLCRPSKQIRSRISTIPNPIEPERDMVDQVRSNNGILTQAKYPNAFGVWHGRAERTWYS